MYLDVHCHYDMFKKPKEIIDECERQKIITIGMTNLPNHFEMGIKHVKGYKYIRLALGLHPQLADRHEDQLQVFKNNINSTSYIGEVGLDFSKEYINTKQRQIDSLEFVFKQICGKKKIVSLHSRKADMEVLELLKKYNIRNAIFHWYTGSIKVLKIAIDEGFYFSVNIAMTRTKSGREIISRIPINRILTETDSPYIEDMGKIIKPDDVIKVIAIIAKFHNKTNDEMKSIVYENFRNLVNQIDFSRKIGQTQIHNL